MFLALAASPAYNVRFKFGIPTTLLEILLVPAILLGLAAARGRLPWRTRYAIPAAVLVAGATLDVFFSPDRRAALGIWKAYFIEPVAAALVIGALAVTRNRVRLLLLGLGVSGTIVAFANIVLSLQTFRAGSFNVVLPPVVIYTTANAIPLYLVPLQAVAFSFLFFSDDLRERVTAAAFLLIASLAVFLSFSRAGWVSLLAVAVFTILFHRARWWLLAVVAAVVVALVAGIPTLRERIRFELDPTSPFNTVRLRFALWRSTLNMLRQHPLFGGGLSGFAQSIEPYRDPAYHERLIYPHNILLNFWSETGLIGLAGFLWLCFEIIRGAVAGMKRGLLPRILSIGMLGVMVAFAAHGLVDVPYFKNDQALAFWALLGLQLAGLRAERPRP
jgi:O-antigen ligase